MFDGSMWAASAENEVSELTFPARAPIAAPTDAAAIAFNRIVDSCLELEWEIAPQCGLSVKSRAARG